VAYLEVEELLSVGTGEALAGAVGAPGWPGRYSGPRCPQPERTATIATTSNAAARGSLGDSLTGGFTITITFYDIHGSVA
jgi:hypothetical protein